MAKPARARFRQWLLKSGAKPLDPKGAYEWARFEAHGILCIIHRNKFGDVSRFSPGLAGQAYQAWKAKREMNLSGVDDRPTVNHWRHLRQAVVLAGAVRRGQIGSISLRGFARDHNCTPRQIGCLGLANGLMTSGMRLVAAHDTLPTTTEADHER